MYFEEHIERLKREFPSSDFRVPFDDATEILKKIEKKFIRVKNVQTDLNNAGQYCNYWAENFKDKIELKKIGIAQLNECLKMLNGEKNYWMILANSENPAIKHHIYDVKLNSIHALLKVSLNDFFIVSKKFEWLIYFQIDKNDRVATIFKNRNHQTPFDKIC
jgi:hypothetical protein